METNEGVRLEEKNNNNQNLFPKKKKIAVMTFVQTLRSNLKLLIYFKRQRVNYSFLIWKIYFKQVNKNYSFNNNQ